MKGRWVVIAVVAVIVIAATVWFLREGTAPSEQIDLIARLASAERRSTLPIDEAVRVVEESIEGDSKPAIFAHPPSRITWTIRVPEEAWLTTSLAIQQPAWEREGDGVLFRIGVSDGRNYEELLSQHVNPIGNTADRRWIPVSLDLSAYSAQEVQLIFNTNTSAPGQGDDPRHDWALWGDPQVIVR